MSTTIAVDALGADRGIAEVVAGIKLAAAAGHKLLVFGPRAQMEDLAGFDNVELVDAPVAIDAGDEPALAVRATPESSIVQAAVALKEGRAEALVSAGPTGATFAAGLFQAKRIAGVRRPALAAMLPVGRCGKTVLLDAGANVDAGAEMLVQFAVMGGLFADAVLEIPSPRVALLTVGEESGKGTTAVTTAYATLSQLDGINFSGNVEGRDIANSVADVVVADGFTGNVALKTLEGTAKKVVELITDAIRSSPVALAGGLLIKPKLRGLRAIIDPNETGGALLLGLRKVVVVAHGSSSDVGIANAIDLAASCVRQDVVARMERALAPVLAVEQQAASASIGSLAGEA